MKDSPHPPLVSREDWLQARRQLLEEEKALTRHHDRVSALVSRAPYAKLAAVRAAKRRTVPWYSSFGSDFNYDFHVTLDENVARTEYNYRPLEADSPPRSGGEAHGLSVFFTLDRVVCHTYSTYARGVESLTDSYLLLNVTPYGRQEDWEDSPVGWPQPPTYG